MRIDQKRRAERRVRAVAGEVDLGDRVAGERVERRARVVAEVARADEHVVDVEEQAAAGPARQLGQEGHLVELVAGEAR